MLAGGNNLFAYSQDFTNAIWGYNVNTVTSNVITAPDGTYTAYAFSGKNVSQYHTVQQNFNFTSGLTYTSSVYAKAGSNIGFYMQYAPSAIIIDNLTSVRVAPNFPANAKRMSAEEFSTYKNEQQKPNPKANPWIFLGPYPTALKTFGCTIPAPANSIHPVFLHKAHPFCLQFGHETSISRPGSTKGK